jgi:uncharacterized protein (DUF488 family)
LRLCTIGFTKKSAAQFFEILRRAGVTHVVDIRLHPDSQLAGFTKRADLEYFLGAILGVGYTHEPLLAPSPEILANYRADRDWPRYVARFESLLGERDQPAGLDRSLFENNVCCLLCSEPTAEQCHRRLVAERIAAGWPDVTIEHLG